MIDTMTRYMLLAACAVLFTTLTAGLADAVEFLTYKDKLGRTVKVKAPVDRAVIFQTYEMIPALEIWDQVVGLGRYAFDNDLMKATKADLVEKIPSVGAGIDLNFEMGPLSIKEFFPINIGTNQLHVFSKNNILTSFLTRLFSLGTGPCRKRNVSKQAY